MMHAVARHAGAICLVAWLLACVTSSGDDIAFATLNTPLIHGDPTGLGLGVDRTRKLNVSNNEGSYVDFRFRVWKQLAGGSPPEGM
jgi:hypothetical protein